MPRVSVPSQGIIEFPEGTSDQEIGTFLRERVYPRYFHEIYDADPEAKDLSKEEYAEKIGYLPKGDFGTELIRALPRSVQRNFRTQQLGQNVEAGGDPERVAELGLRLDLLAAPEDIEKKKQEFAAIEGESYLDTVFKSAGYLMTNPDLAASMLGESVGYDTPLQLLLLHPGARILGAGAAALGAGS